MNEFANFNATLADVKFNGKNTEIKLKVDNRSAAGNMMFLMQNIDEMVIVNLGDPQMKMEFSEEFRKGISGMIAPNGVVESLETPDDDDQNKIEFEDDTAPFETGEENLNDADTEEGDFIDDDMDFVDDDQENDDEAPEAIDEFSERAAIEEYILEEKPQFPEIAFDFPEILREKRDGGKTWIDISKEQGVPSTVLQSAWQKYKKLVSKQMGQAS